MYTAREIIACALRERTLQPFLDAGITRARVNDILGKTIFTTEDLNAYGTLLDYWDRHGKVMTIEQFEKSFPAVSYDLPESDYTPAELIEDFAEGYRRLAAQVGVMDLSEMVDKGMVTDIPAYLEVFKTQLAGIKGRDAKPYRKVTLAELEDLPQPEPLIEGVLDAGMVTMLSGPFSTGKSFIALDWALSIASGETWMGHEVKQCRVLYVSAEGAHGQSKRVKAWKSEHPKARPDDNFAMIINPVQFGEPEHLEALLEDAKDADVIIIDTVARCSTGLEENSTKDMGLFVHELYKLRDAHSECGTTMIIVHHTGHDKSRARGASALPAGVDSIYLTESSDPHTLITVKSMKRKDGPPPKPVHMKLVEAEDSVVLESVDAVFAEANSHGDRSKAIIEYLSEHPMANQQEVADALGEVKSTISRTMKILVDAGKVMEKSQGRSKQYWLP